MAIFSFDDNDKLGKVRSVDTRKVIIHVNRDEDLRMARVGQLVALSPSSAVDYWLIGIIDKVIKTPVIDKTTTMDDQYSTSDDSEINHEEADSSLISTSLRESVLNMVHLTLVGTVGLSSGGTSKFSRSLTQVPEIDAICHVLRDQQLQDFMGLLSSKDKTKHSLEIGRYTIDEDAKAYLDGNKLFQRHASLLGSTGSGKSWSVASILEQAAKLPSSNIIVFDLHGEYRKLTYAEQLRVPGPDLLGSEDGNLLYLPYWLLNAEELLAMFVDRSEQGAHNQVTVFQDAVISEKESTLKEQNKVDILSSFTLDSPIPFNVQHVVDELSEKNEERVTNPKTGREVNGPFYGQLTRLLIRISSRMRDKRYGFLFQAPDAYQKYDAMANIVNQLMDYSANSKRIKIIDFSEVPVDILPVIVSLVARVIHQVQFWTNEEDRQPIALVCDEAHLYLPKKDGRNPIELRAVENFEKIAKEGRKYGVALLIVSQRPSDVSATILSQCNNVIALRLTNSDDQSTVKHLMPESLVGLMDMLPILDVGEAFIVGDSILLPSRVRISPPNEKPRSATINFWDKWGRKPSTPNFTKVVENIRKQNRQ